MVENLLTKKSTRLYQKNKTSIGKDVQVEKLEPLCTVGGNLNGVAIIKTVWQFLKKQKIELPYDPAIPPGYISKKLEARSQRGICTPTFMAALLTRAKMWKQLKCPFTDEWISKNVLYIHNTVLLGLKQIKFCNMPKYECTLRTLG